MSILTQVDPDVNDEQLIWLEFMNFVPAIFLHLVARGIEPEVAADLVADDGLPVCDNPSEFAEDGEPVAEWPGMYEAVT
jgi:hypothetical protein